MKTLFETNNLSCQYVHPGKRILLNIPAESFSSGGAKRWWGFARSKEQTDFSIDIWGASIDV